MILFTMDSKNNLIPQQSEKGSSTATSPGCTNNTKNTCISSTSNAQADQNQSFDPLDTTAGRVLAAENSLDQINTTAYRAYELHYGNEEEPLEVIEEEVVVLKNLKTEPQKTEREVMGNRQERIKQLPSADVKKRNNTLESNLKKEKSSEKKEEEEKSSNPLKTVGTAVVIAGTLGGSGYLLYSVDETGEIQEGDLSSESSYERKDD